MAKMTRYLPHVALAFVILPAELASGFYGPALRFPMQLLMVGVMIAAIPILFLGDRAITSFSGGPRSTPPAAAWMR